MLQVNSTAEFRRVLHLPRRPQVWSEAKLDDAVETLTDHFRTPRGTWRVRPIQARALCEAGDVGRLFARLAPSAGKTLLSALLFSLWEARRGLLLVPAKLREKTLDDWAVLQKHWRIPPLLGLDDTGGRGEPVVRLLSYEHLSSVRQAAFLEEYRPDVTVPDEAHAFARMAAARSRRYFRWLRAARREAGNFDAYRFAPMSGSFMRKSVREDAHLYVAALGDLAPVPDHYPDLVMWSGALDSQPEQSRVGLGALTEFCSPDERAAVERTDDWDERRLIAARAYGRRVRESPGVVSTEEPFAGAKLTIARRQIAVPAAVRAAVTRLRVDGVLPNRDEVLEAIEVWAHARQLVNGFSYRWDPPAPPEWQKAKKAWNDVVKTVLKSNREGLDSPLQVWNAVAAGRFGKVPAFEAWNKIRGTFKPNPVPYWIDDYAFKDAEKWALETGGIVWTQHSTAVTKDGASLSEGAADAAIGGRFKRIPYFGGGPAGEGIKTWRGPCAASIAAHGTGKNLVQWDQALLMTPPSSGSTLEQVLARLQRDGQTAAAVKFWVYVRAKEDDAALKTCLTDARYVEALTGQPQRVLGAVFEGWDETAPAADLV